MKKMIEIYNYKFFNNNVIIVFFITKKVIIEKCGLEKRIILYFCLKI